MQSQKIALKFNIFIAVATTASNIQTAHIADAE